MTEYLLLAAASLLAGLIDAIVGGGGLIAIPALFSVFPTASPATLFGTNKAAAVWGTGWATVQYAKKVRLNWRTLIPAFASALCGSFVGAWGVTMMDPSGLRRALPVILCAVLVYTLAKKELGKHHAPHFNVRREMLLMAAIGLVIGFYDGFFGTGTGSFFVFLFVRVLGYDFLNASASAKLLNTSTNIAALALFAYKGHVWWHFAIVMAVANVAGSILGTRLALKHGAGFIRWVFIAVVSLLIMKTGYDALTLHT
jgi:uncharacterized protein